MKHIVEQDRDRIFKYTGEQCFYIQTVWSNEVDMGSNLFMDCEFLGTFDSHEGAVKEIGRIISSKDEIVAISGYFEGSPDCEQN